MIRILPIVLLTFISLWCVSAQNKVSGFVYEDLNKNGVKDLGEPGISQVGVSNGEQVVRTDKSGAYQLSVDKDQIIFVIKPTGYKVPVDENQLPQFYYIHKPEGSPVLNYKGVSPTGPLPEEVNFPLFATQESDRFSALIFGDPQAYNKKEIDYYYRGIIKELEGIQGVEFGLSLGDLVGDDLSLFKPYIKATQAVGIPWYNVLGNHDLNFDAELDQHSDETFEAHFGPTNYAFNIGKVHFIVLDDVLYPDPRDKKGYWGGFRKDQLNFVINDLKYVPQDHLIVLAFHIPISETGKDTFNDKHREALFRLLKKHPYTLSLSAHTHIQKQDYFGKESGWRHKTPHHHYNVGTTSGDWYSGALNESGVPISTMRDGTPKGYAYIHFDANQYRIQYKVAEQPISYQIELYHPKVVAQANKTRAGLFANFFMGSKTDLVEYRVDSGKWKTMRFTPTLDPSYQLNLFKRDYANQLMPGKRGSNAIPSTHLWYAKLPAELTIGKHQIEVRATDRYGQVHYAQSVYNIETPQNNDYE